MVSLSGQIAVQYRYNLSNEASQTVLGVFGAFVAVQRSDDPYQGAIGTLAGQGVPEIIQFDLINISQDTPSLGETRNRPVVSPHSSP